MTEDDWFEKYKPLANPINAGGAVWSIDGKSYTFETFGKEFDFVKEQPLDRVWTVLECDDKWILASGYHYVNRLAYMVATVPLDKADASIEVLLEDFSELDDEAETEDL